MITVSKKILFEIATKYLLYFNVIFILGYTVFVFMDSVWSNAAASLFMHKFMKYFILSFVICMGKVFN